MSFVLRIKSSSGEIKEVPIITGETAIGRDPSNSLVLSGRGVSRRHAKLLLKDERLTLIDLGSTYGTKVGNMPTLRKELHPGDTILIGMHQLEVQRPTQHTNLSPLNEEFSEEAFPNEVTYDPAKDSAKLFKTVREASNEDLSRWIENKETKHKENSSQTIQVDSQKVQFLDDNHSDDAEVIDGQKSPYLDAVERISTTIHQGNEDFALTSSTKQSEDYHALFLMYKVSELLGRAKDLDQFLNSVSDLVMDEVEASTVVVLTANQNDELIPRTIRHRGTLEQGEVPISRGILDLVVNTNSSVISGDAIKDERIDSGNSLALYNIRAVVASPLMLDGKLRGILYLNRSGPLSFTRAEGQLVGALASLISSGMERGELLQSVNEEKARRRSLERFHPPEVVKQLSTGENIGKMTEHHATALTCDIIGIDELMTKVSPHEVAHVLGEYYDLLYEKIFANTGSLIKLQSAWGLALFGMHASTKKDATWAVEAGRQLLDEFTALSVLWPCNEYLHLCCAVDSGIVIAGAVGASERLEYLALGSPIKNTKMMVQESEGSGLLITESIRKDLPPHFEIEEKNLGINLSTYLIK